MADLVQRSTVSYRRALETGSMFTGQAIQDPEKSFVISLFTHLFTNPLYKKIVNSADLKVILHLGVFNGYTGHLSVILDLGMIEV